MCGIIGIVSKNDIVTNLLNGLYKLEYRGYDSSGLAVLENNGCLYRLRRVGKVDSLIQAVKENPISGKIGIAHTRWATHGLPTINNAHPHVSENIAVVHNGIIENYQSLKKFLKDKGYLFITQTDTEIIAHLIHWEQNKNGGTFPEIVRRASDKLYGNYGIIVMDSKNPKFLVAIQSNSPLIIGYGKNENFFSSDQMALSSLTNRFTFLEKGDIAEISCSVVRIWDKTGKKSKRPEIKRNFEYDFYDIGSYNHYMKKEIFEQPKAIKDTIHGRIKEGKIILPELNNNFIEFLKKIRHIQIVACGTSYHSSMVSKYWFEELAGIPCNVEIASEFSCRKHIVQPYSLLIAVSQSGETADTLSALRLSKTLGYIYSLSICNVTSSTLVHESDTTLITKIGMEISVASTKSFTSQLAILLLLVAYIGNINKKDSLLEERVVSALQKLPYYIEQMLLLDKYIKEIASNIYKKQHIFFLGRGILYPIAMEGALKLKEISYIHAEAYTAGELKHGPLALIDNNTPVIFIAYNDDLLIKIKSNIEEICARNGIVYVFADKKAHISPKNNVRVMQIPNIPKTYVDIVPISYAVLMQLLAYYTALIKGNDIDRPRNLAKSVTVE